MTSEENRKLYNLYKNELETIYDHIANGIRIKSKCEWYDHGENFGNLILKKDNLILKKKKYPITEKYPKASKHLMKHFLNETSQKLMSKNNDSLIL